MHIDTTRRGFIGISSAATLVGISGATAFLAKDAMAIQGAKPPPSNNPEREKPAALKADDVQAVVGAAHRDIDRVRTLLDAQPSLVNATWDWGGGDWETPLGAAGHTGQVEIAELVLSRGGRIELHAAAMLGWLDVIKAATSARPGVENILGPHAIPMHSHARVGGERAKAVFAHLESLECVRDEPLDDTKRAGLVGRYRVEGSDHVLLVIQANRRLLIQPPGKRAWYMLHQGQGRFRPADELQTEVAFTLNSDATAALAMLVDDGNSQSTAVRIE